MPALRRLLAVAGLSCGALVAWAAPASAHAILLRTEPAPQTTVKTAPAAVRLHFSEPVEVAFGAVRVFDVNGKRVDPGTIHRADGNREVDVPVTLKNGTYTVTWRVTSADGHPVHGGFGFFVGNPSTISAVAVPGDAGAGTFVTWGYGIVRFLWFGGLLAVVGLVAVRRWVWTPAVRAAGLAGSPAAEGFRRRFRPALAGAWVMLVVAGLLAIVFQAATVSGLSLLQSAKPSVMHTMLSTEFGRWWLAEMGCALGLGVAVAGLVARRPLGGVRPAAWIWVTFAFAAGVAAATALNGHARTLGHAPVMVPALTVHLLAAGVWVGGLGALVVLARTGWREVPERGRPALLRGLVLRFGRLALAAVAVLFATGVVNSIGDFGAFSDLWKVEHGRVVAVKIGLLAVALVLAAGHRWRTPKRLVLTEPAAAAPRAVVGFERTSRLELGVVAVAVACAAALVALVPGRSLALAAKGPVNLERKSGPYTVQLFVDPTAVGANEVHVTFVDLKGLAAAEVSSTGVSLAGLRGPNVAPGEPVAMRLISPGHFVGDTSLPAPGRYRLSVTTDSAPGQTAIFDFRLYGRKS